MATHQSRLNSPGNANNVGRATTLYNQYREIYPDFVPVGHIAHVDVYELQPGDTVTFNGAVITAAGQFVAPNQINDNDDELTHGQVGAWHAHH